MNDQNNNMATASMIMGILAIVFVCCYGGLLFGSLGILFALLSRTGERMKGQARAGMILSVIGLMLGIFLISAFWSFMLLGSGWDRGPIQDLPAYPPIPEITLPDNQLWNIPVWMRGGLA